MNNDKKSVCLFSSRLGANQETLGYQNMFACIKRYDTYLHGFMNGLFFYSFIEHKLFKKENYLSYGE